MPTKTKQPVKFWIKAVIIFAGIAILVLSGLLFNSETSKTKLTGEVQTIEFRDMFFDVNGDGVDDYVVYYHVEAIINEPETNLNFQSGGK